MGILLVNRIEGQLIGAKYKVCDNRIYVVIAESRSELLMADLLNLAMLVCASISALAFGILSAYAILRAGFALLRPPPRQAVEPRPELARSLP